MIYYTLKKCFKLLNTNGVKDTSTFNDHHFVQNIERIFPKFKRIEIEKHIALEKDKIKVHNRKLDTFTI